MSTGGTRDVSGEGVQNALLTLLDGRVSSGSDSRKHEPVDTSKLLFVCTGAFVGLDEIVNKRVGKASRKQIGFIARAEENVSEFPDQPVYEALVQCQTKDLVSFGMIPEFIGRFATITVLHELSRNDLRAIVSEKTERSPLELQQKLAAVHGIELELSDDALGVIADQAQELGTGARGLHRLIGQALDCVDHRWPELADAGVGKVVITDQTVLDGVEPELIHDVGELTREDEELREISLRGLPKPLKESNESPFEHQQDGAVSNPDLPKGITDVSGWTDARVRRLLDKIRPQIGYIEVTGSARKWWKTFEDENAHRPALILRLTEELAVRKATISEFFLSYVYSNTDNIQANLHYLDYNRLRKEEEEKKVSESPFLRDEEAADPLEEDFDAKLQEAQEELESLLEKQKKLNGESPDGVKDDSNSDAEILLQKTFDELQEKVSADEVAAILDKYGVDPDHPARSVLDLYENEDTNGAKEENDDSNSEVMIEIEKQIDELHEFIDNASDDSEEEGDDKKD